MLWVWLVCAALIGLGSGLFGGFRAAKLLMQPVIMELRRNIANDRNFLLSVLRRELANWMFRRDPDRYRRAYKAAHDATMAIGMADRAEQRRQLAKLAEQYPFYTDFDLVSTRDYILYTDALIGNSYDDIERHYIDIIHFQALQAALDETWRSVDPTSNKELELLDSYLPQFKDTVFRMRMGEALREFYAYRKGKGDNASLDVYETTRLVVRRVAHFAETRYGVHFKDTNEFGLYGVFYADGRDEPFTSFYRSNVGFNEEIILHDLVIDDPF